MIGKKNFDDGLISQERNRKKQEVTMFDQEMSRVEQEALNYTKILQRSGGVQTFYRENTTSNSVHTWFLQHVHQCDLKPTHLLALNKACRKDGCQEQ